uniref:Uncharacterized protein n=1 Tax=Romanomermis culicivorax TaxID=13658 RepID=A0A915L3J8_ROMCU
MRFGQLTHIANKFDGENFAGRFDLAENGLVADVTVEDSGPEDFATSVVVFVVVVVVVVTALASDVDDASFAAFVVGDSIFCSVSAGDNDVLLDVTLHLTSCTHK